MRSVLLAALTLALASPAGAVTLSEFPVPGRSFSITSISDLVVAPDGNLWFTRSDPDVPSGAEMQIFDPRTERLTNVATPTGASTMVAADGAIWIAPPQFGGAPENLTRIDVATHAAETVPVEGRPLAIAAAPGGPLYVALEGQDAERYRTADIAVIDKGTRTPRRILRLTTPHPVLGQPLGVGAPLFNALAVASDGAVWAYELAFTAPGTTQQVVKLLRLDPATGAYSEYGPLEGWSVVRRIVAGKAGDAWFGLQRFSADVDGAPKEALGHITAAGAVEIIPYRYFGYTATGLAVTGDGGSGTRAPRSTTTGRATSSASTRRPARSARSSRLASRSASPSARTGSRSGTWTGRDRRRPDRAGSCASTPIPPARRPTPSRRRTPPGAGWRPSWTASRAARASPA